MKLKYYLKGLGAGILFATIVLSISFAVYNNEAEKKSQDDIIAAALAAGMVWPEKEKPTESTPTESTPTESNPEGSTPTDSTPVSDETTTEPTTPKSTTPEQTTPEPTTPEATTQEPTTPEETTQEPTTPEETTQEPTTPEETTSESTTPEETTTVWNLEDCIIYKGTDKVRIEIRKGMTSYDAAKILEAAGVLKSYYDRERFNDYVIAKGYSGYVMIGVFEIPTGASYDDIIKIICRTQ